MGLNSASGAGERRTQLLLALGAAIGIGMAVASMMTLAASRDALEDGVVARVNDVDIRGNDYLRAVAALASDRRSPLTAGDRRHVLDRLIDEELLVQYGIDLGLVRSDRRVRGDLVSAVLAAQVASVDGYQPTDAEAEAFYAENSEFFALPGRLRLAVLWIRGEPARSDDEAMARAQEALAAVRAGEPFAEVRERFGDQQIAPLPDGYLPAAKVRDYVGPTIAARSLDLPVGEVSEPIRAGAGVYLVEVVDREPRRVPELSAVRGQVDAEMQRRAGDDAVRSTLERLRREGSVVIAEPLP